jgi:hypothetical protein
MIEAQTIIARSFLASSLPRSGIFPLHAAFWEAEKNKRINFLPQKWCKWHLTCLESA